jgi:hypothetical protein
MEQTIKPGITKQILTPGDQSIKVLQKSKVTIEYTLYRISQHTPIKIDSSIDRKLGLVFTIGAGEVITALEECVLTMQPREKSQFRVKKEYFDQAIILDETPSDDYRLDIELKNVATDRVLPHERIEQASSLKERGNTSFKSKLFVDAISSYTSAISIFDNWGATPAQIIDMNALRVVLHSNLAACYLKIDKFKDASNAASEALNIEPGCVKAVVRLAKAKVGQHEYEIALNGLREFDSPCEVRPSSILTSRILKIKPLLMQRL